MDVKIFEAARERILEIWDYTEETWGEAQADRYVRGLVTAIKTIALNRYRWKAVPNECLPGVYCFRHQHHFIFFRELSKETLGVISILHENMDIPARLRQDSERNADD